MAKTGLLLDKRLSRLDERWGNTSGYTVVSADNARLVLAGPDGERREYVDFMSAFGAVNFGHRNPAIDRCLARGADTSGVSYPAEADEVAEWLCERLDKPRDRVLFQVGGSFAVSTALALAQHARPGRIAAIRGGFHGLGADSLAASSAQRDLALHDTALCQLLDARVLRLTPPGVPQQWDDISCLIYEPVQGANGYIPLDVSWLHDLETAAHRAGVVTIADEIQSGFYRHGVLSPARAAGLEPDILLYSKSLTNGVFPLSAVVYDEWLEPSRRQPFLAHTFQTATLGYHAASAVASYVDTTPLAEMALGVSEVLAELAERLVATGAGERVHVTGPSLSLHPTAAAAPDLVRRAFAAGLIVFVGGADFDRIRVAPPLTIPHDDLRYGVALLGDILGAKRAGGSGRAGGRLRRSHTADAGRGPMDRDEFYDRIRAFIREPRPGRDAVTDVPVDEDDNLFDLGLVNSFSMVRLLVHIEELLGVQVDVTQHEPESFFTLRGMYDSLALASSPS